MARLSVNCFFTDNEFNFIEKPDGYNMKKLKYSSVKLPPGTIENGIIYREEKLLKILKETFRLFKIKARRVNLIIHEELFTFRKIEVPIIYKPSEIGDYIKSQVGKTIMIPFNEMSMDYVIHKKNEDSYEVIMFYAPKHELKSYVELFYEMNMQVVRTDIPPLSLHRLYYYRKYEDSDIKFEVPRRVFQEVLSAFAGDHWNIKKQGRYKIFSLTPHTQQNSGNSGNRWTKNRSRDKECCVTP